MGLLDIFKSSKKEERATVSNYSLTGANLFGAGGYNAAGVAVNTTTAMQVAAVQACIRAISEDIASLPFFVYQRNDNGKEKASQHPLYKLLHDQPNPDMTSFTFREVMTAQVLLHGNAYAYIEKKNARAVALFPLPSNTVYPYRDEQGELKYRVNTNSKQIILSAADILHITGLSFDGIKGISPIEQAARTIGISLAADTHAEKFFANGTAPSGILQCDKRVTDEAKANIKASWSSLYSGVGNSNKTPLLEEGITFNPLSVDPKTSQLLEVREFQVVEIARLFRIPPHMIGDLSRATFSNIEHQSINYVQTTLRSWLVRWEQEINRKLFFESEKETYFAEMKVDALLRGDLSTRYSNYATGITYGWLTPKRIAVLENLSTEGLSDTPIQPLNMASTDSSTDEKESEPESESKPIEEENRSINLLVQDAARRVLTKEINAIKRAAKKYADDNAGFESWAKEFYRDNEQTIRTTFNPILFAFYAEAAPELIDKLVARHTTDSIKELNAAIQNNTVDKFLSDHIAKAGKVKLWIK